jgi:hypothetical protein
VERLLKDQRIVWALGAAVAVVLAIIFALLFGGKDKHPKPPPASQSGLQVSVAPSTPLNTTQPLRCFVNGQFVGQMSLAECAKRNGVSAQALDVGQDANGAMTAAPAASLAPPPNAPPQAAAQGPAAPQPSAGPQTPSAAPADAGLPGACLHFVGGEWRTISDGMTRNACLQALFAGKCVRPGEADYGHWGEMTVRLVFPSQVQISSDNRSFHTLYDQGRACEAGAAR